MQSEQLNRTESVNDSPDVWGFGFWKLKTFITLLLVVPECVVYLASVFSTSASVLLF